MMRRGHRTICVSAGIVLCLLVTALGLSSSSVDDLVTWVAPGHYQRLEVRPLPDPQTTLPPGSILPDDQTCAARVHPAPEIRPANTSANTTMPRSVDVNIDGASREFNETHRRRITGSYTGTTDEILQWGACKWGFALDLVRARAVSESWWRQSTLGDRTDSEGTCMRIGKTAPCYESYGLMQVRGTIHEGTYPLSRESTSFNVDYSLAWLRACYEGAFPWLGDEYARGDDIGCAGAWFSGRWYDQAARDYLASLLSHRDSATWETPEFIRAQDP